MGNLIKDFWTYEYNGRSYYGIVEVVKGDLRFRRRDHKFETRVEKAIAYLMDPEAKVLSHMSIQSYNKYLTGSCRNADEESFYPFFIEFEPKKGVDDKEFSTEYQNAVQEAYRLVTYLIHELDVEEKDILITINNSRSIYVFVNPKTYFLRPRKDLHKIYKLMFEEINEVLNLQYVDLSQFRFFGLIKTPGCYYRGGYVNPISYAELALLCSNPCLKKKLTSNKRTINIDIPGNRALGMLNLFENSKDKIKQSQSQLNWARPIINKNKPSDKQKDTAIEKHDMLPKIAYITQSKCIKYIENADIEKGNRNYALVSLAIAYKKLGYKEEQVLNAVQQTAYRWNHDEDESIIKSKVKTVFEKDYNFSCSYVRDHIDIGSDMCKGCKFCAQSLKTRFKINKHAIARLHDKKASLRHFRAYIIMEYNNLFDTFFKPEEYDLDQRVIRELSKYIETPRTLENEYVKLEMIIPEKNYIMPAEFISSGTMDGLGESLKHFLVLYTRFTYKATDRYGLMRVSINKIMSTLGYKSRQGVYMLLKKLKEIGLAIFKKGYLFSLYFKSYKVISIDEYINAKTEKKSNIDQIRGEQVAVNSTTRIIKTNRGSP